MRLVRIICILGFISCIWASETNEKYVPTKSDDDHDDSNDLALKETCCIFFLTAGTTAVHDEENQREKRESKDNQPSDIRRQRSIQIIHLLLIISIFANKSSQGLNKIKNRNKRSYLGRWSSRSSESQCICPKTYFCTFSWVSFARRLSGWPDFPRQCSGNSLSALSSSQINLSLDSWWFITDKSSFYFPKTHAILKLSRDLEFHRGIRGHLMIIKTEISNYRKLLKRGYIYHIYCLYSDNLKTGNQCA